MNVYKRKAFDKINCDRPKKIISNEIRSNNSILDLTVTIFQLFINLYIEYENNHIIINLLLLKEIYSATDNCNKLSSNHEAFLWMNNQETNIVIFSLETNLILIVYESITVFLYGIYRYCPKYFTQLLFTIHGFQNKKLKIKCWEKLFWLNKRNGGL